VFRQSPYSAAEFLARELEKAGAKAVFENALDLREHVDGAFDRSVDQRITRPLRHVRKPLYVPINCPIRYCASHFSNRLRDQPRTRTSRSKSTGSVASQTRSTASP
jgi:hypothetical protein